MASIFLARIVLNTGRDSSHPLPRVLVETISAVLPYPPENKGWKVSVRADFDNPRFHVLITWPLVRTSSCLSSVRLAAVLQPVFQGSITLVSALIDDVHSPTPGIDARDYRFTVIHITNTETEAQRQERIKREFVQDMYGSGARHTKKQRKCHLI